MSGRSCQAELPLEEAFKEVVMQNAECTKPWDPYLHSEPSIDVCEQQKQAEGRLKPQLGLDDSRLRTDIPCTRYPTQQRCYTSGSVTAGGRFDNTQAQPRLAHLKGGDQMHDFSGWIMSPSSPADHRRMNLSKVRKPGIKLE